MLIHQGKKRTYGHNFRLASLLSLTAGFVNAAGYLGFAVLTTNVTGHAALFAEQLALEDWKTARIIALWMLLFLSGAFTSSLIVTWIGKNQRYSYVIPVFIEVGILFCTGMWGHTYNYTLGAKELFAGSLLFAMGLQNALVSLVSGSVVRTTHLTGTFTDLGIELAQILQRKMWRDVALRARIKLHTAIIVFFMSGAVAGAYLYRLLHFQVFFIPAGILCFTLIYDIFRIRIKRYYSQWRNAEIN
jgi:uncharacterized membrane protein YoaK (UPF0700 family)